MTLPRLTFNDLPVEGRPLDRDQLTILFSNYLSWPPERRWTVFHDDVAKQLRTLETLAENVGLPSPASLKVLEGLAPKLKLWRRYTGLLKVPGIVAAIESGALGKGATPEKLVIYCTSADVMRELNTALKDYNPVMMYHDTPAVKREAVIRRFTKRSACRVFLSTVKAAAIAIDLSVSNCIVFAEADWDPLLNLAAVRRCYRESPHKAVTVWFAGVKGTIDERLARLYKQRTRQLVGETTKPDDIFAD